MTPPRPRSEAAPADARRTSTTRLTAAALVCAATALVLVGSGLWVTVAGVVVAAAGLGLGVAGLLRSRGISPRRLLVTTAVAAIVLGLLGLLTGGARLALWPVAEAYEQCVSSTVTLSGTARCQQELEESIWRYLSGDDAASAAPGGDSGA